MRSTARVISLAHTTRGAAFLAWLASELAFRALGGRFDTTPLTTFWQFLDPVLLETRLLESLTYLHAQPPGFNLLLGLGLKLGGSAWPSLFALGFALLSFGFLWTLSALLGELGARSTGRLIVLTLFALSPGFLLYGHALFYTQLEAWLLTAAVLALVRACGRKSPAAFAAFCGCIAALAWARSAYHLGFVAIGLALGIHGARAAGLAGRRIWLPAACASALVLGLYAKNAVLFRSFSSSTWLGMNLAKVVLPEVPQERLASLVRAGSLSPLALVPPFSALSTYGVAAQVPRAYAGVPAVAAVHKHDGGDNMNHHAYIALSQRLLRDSAAAVRAEPRAYLSGVARAARLYLASNGECMGLEGNEAALERWRDVYEPIVFGRVELPSRTGPPRMVYPVIALGITLLPVLLLALLFTRRADELPVTGLTFALWCMVYVAVVSVLLDVGENARFRYSVDPLYLAAGAALLGARSSIRGLTVPSRRWSARARQG